MLPSGNDAAHRAGARTSAAPSAAFVRADERSAREMGLRLHALRVARAGSSTRATTRARVDLAALTRAVLDQPAAGADRRAPRARSCRSRSRAGGCTSTTHNPLLRAGYPGTHRASRPATPTPPAAAWSPRRAATARRLGVVLLHSPDPGRQARKLLDRGFAALRARSDDACRRGAPRLGGLVAAAINSVAGAVAHLLPGPAGGRLPGADRERHERDRGHAGLPACIVNDGAHARGLSALTRTTRSAAARRHADMLAAARRPRRPRGSTRRPRRPRRLRWSARREHRRRLRTPLAMTSGWSARAQPNVLARRHRDRRRRHRVAATLLARPSARGRSDFGRPRAGAAGLRLALRAVCHRRRTLRAARRADGRR